MFKRIPWTGITINTFVLDSKGKGMSKSKGNSVWVDDLIEKYGVDAFRYWVGSASLGSDLPFNEQELVAGKKFLNKLWNASKFVFMNLQDYKHKKPNKLEEIDIWMLQKLSKTTGSVKKLYLSYNISGARKEIEEFFWHTFADNYLEIVKKRIYNSKGNDKISAQYTLYECLLSIIKMISPITCFITEEIYQTYFKNTEKIESIHISEWPREISKTNKNINDTGDILIGLLSKIRYEKTKAQKSMNSEIILTLSKENIKALKNMKEDFKSVTNAKEIKEGKFKVDFI
jgi:valyl-tRNA synthetase